MYVFKMSVDWGIWQMPLCDKFQAHLKKNRKILYLSFDYVLVRHLLAEKQNSDYWMTLTLTLTLEINYCISGNL